jgi:hypothetical protein
MFRALERVAAPITFINPSHGGTSRAAAFCTWRANA